MITHTNLKNSPKFQIFEFWNEHYTRHTFWSCLIRCANMKWIRWVLLKIQSGHDSVHRQTDGQTDKVIPVYPPFQLQGYNKTLDSCGVMFGEVKLGEADYTVVWETLLFMSNILCQISWKRPFEPTASSRLFAVGKYENICHKCCFCEYDKTQDLC